MLIHSVADLSWNPPLKLPLPVWRCSSCCWPLRYVVQVFLVAQSGPLVPKDVAGENWGRISLETRGSRDRGHGLSSSSPSSKKGKRGTSSSVHGAELLLKEGNKHNRGAASASSCSCRDGGLSTALPALKGGGRSANSPRGVRAGVCIVVVVQHLAIGSL